MKRNLSKNAIYILALFAITTVSIFSNACATETKIENTTNANEIENTSAKKEIEMTSADENKEEKTDKAIEKDSKKEDKSEDKAKDESKKEEAESEATKEDKSKKEQKTNKLDEAVSKLKKGAKYGASRANLINSGWQPVAKSGEKTGNEKYLAEKLKFTEVDSCSGTGVGYCSLVLKAPDGRTLTITTVNNDSVQKGDPTIESWEVN